MRKRQQEILAKSILMTDEREINLAECKLIERARQGDQAAYGALYQQHYRRIYALCLRLLSDTGLAEDALQGCFIQAWRKLEQYRQQASFTSWLHRIAVNECLGLRRKRRPWLLFSNDTAEHSGSVIKQQDSRYDLDKAIARLPLRPRQVLVLHDIEGYTHDQVAEILNIAQGTSKNQLHRARKQLKEWLRHD